MTPIDGLDYLIQGGYVPALRADIDEVSLDLPEDLDYETWASFGPKFARLTFAIMWWLGDWWAFGELHYGEKAKVAADNALALQTCKNAGVVARSVEKYRRRYNLLWHHHAEVAMLSVADQEMLIFWERGRAHWEA